MTKIAPMAPPISTRREWIRQNLTKSPLHVVLSFSATLLAGYILFSLLNWAVFTATFIGNGKEDCTGEGACWPFVSARFNQFMYGFYPREEQWRINIVAILLMLSVAWLLIKRAPFKKHLALWLVLGVPVLVIVLIHGAFGLEVVPTSKWGGLTLTLTIATTAIAVSLPLGTALALGRRSKMPVVSMLSITFIEVVRAVPLISVLFMASVLLPIFLPQDVTVDKLLRALVGVALFASAYMAEVVRGGLQAVSEGQSEAAKSLGMPDWQITLLIVLPQALRIAIPGIANTFIAVFKDTSLVIIIGLFDLLGMIQAGVNDTRWIGMEMEGFAFAAAIYWVFCWSISRFGQEMEKKSQFGR